MRTTGEASWSVAVASGAGVAVTQATIIVLDVKPPHSAGSRLDRCRWKVNPGLPLRGGGPSSYRRLAVKRCLETRWRPPILSRRADAGVGANSSIIPRFGR